VEETRTRTLVDDIAKGFERYGWGYERIDPVTFRTGITGEAGPFVVLLRVTEHWVVTSINPFVERPNGGWGDAALKFLATVNHAMSLAKVGIDQEDDAFLTVELPTEGFGDTHLYDALAALSHYAHKIAVPLLQAIRIDELNRN
jgi:hypothetical protein